ncbi:MAG: efflux RND transporter periplasmic adaptor subunit [Myxococcota bacterium]
MRSDSPPWPKALLRCALVVGLFVGVGACSLPASEAAQERKGPPPTAKVVVATARREVLTDRWVFLGEVQATSRAMLSAGADAEVRSVVPRVGDRVAAGDVVARLDGTLAKARVAAARASKTATSQELAQAQRDRERAEQLGASVLAEAEIERDVTRANTLADRTTALKAAEREAKAALGRHRVVAPFSGVVAGRFVDPGDWVGPGDPVLELVDDTQVEVMVAASRELLLRVQAGDVAVVRGEGKQVEAEIRGIVRALDPVTRTAKVRLVPNQVPSWMLPGTSLDVEFAVPRDEPGVVVPRDALVYGAVQSRVVTVHDGKAVLVPVEVVATVDDSALVRAEGLAVGDTVVVRGNERLSAGQPVVVAEPDGQPDRS